MHRAAAAARARTSVNAGGRACVRAQVVREGFSAGNGLLRPDGELDRRRILSRHGARAPTRARA